MKALDTNVLVRFLVNDDPRQGSIVRSVFLEAERTSAMFLVTTPVVLELLWVLKTIYAFSREESVQALDLLRQVAVLRFQDEDVIGALVQLGGTTRADLPDLLIGLIGRSAGCDTTLTFEKGLSQTDLFQTL